MDFHKEIEQILVSIEKCYGAVPNFDYDEVGFEKFIYEVKETGKGHEEVIGGKKGYCIQFWWVQNSEKAVGDEYGLKEIWATGTILDGNSSRTFL